MLPNRSACRDEEGGVKAFCEVLDHLVPPLVTQQMRRSKIVVNPVQYCYARTHRVVDGSPTRPLPDVIGLMSAEV